MIEVATQDDVPALLAMLPALVAEIGGPPVQQRPGRAYLEGTIRDGYVLVERAPGLRLIVATMGIHVLKVSWNDDYRFLKDGWLYVRPAYRRLGGARRLVAAAKGIADRLELSLIVGQSRGLDPRKARWFQMQGLKPCGGIYAYRL